MENIIKEVLIENSPSSVTAKGIEKILFQMKKCTCRIIIADENKGTGFFCKIKVNKNKEILPVLITNNHILNSEDLRINKLITFIFNEDKEIRKIKIDEQRKVYTDKELDVSFIEIKPNDNINDYLEVDEDIIEVKESIRETKYKKYSIYLMHYPKNDEVEVSFGQILYINDLNIIHICNADNGSSGAPILSLKSFKVIGIHLGGIYNKNNKGTIIKYPIVRFNEKYYRKNKLTIYIKNNENWGNYTSYGFFGAKFVENNKNNCKVMINSIEYQLQKYYEKNLFLQNQLGNLNEASLTLLEINKITDMSYMFSSLDLSNFQFDFSEWDMSDVVNMSYMFYGCGNIPDISKLNTSNVKYMSYMFCESSLDLLYISRWNTSNVVNMNNMFKKCNLSFIKRKEPFTFRGTGYKNYIYKIMANEPVADISKYDNLNKIELKWDTSNVKDMSFMFSEYWGNLPDISNWNTSNVINMSGIFSGNYYLKVLPNISKWKTYNLNSISRIFENCDSLESLPDISNWDTSKINLLDYVFKGCKSLKYLPDISKWNTSKVSTMRGLFEDCNSLLSLPDISNWNISKVKYINALFCGCHSLINLPDISNWKISNVIDMSWLFRDCKSIKQLPDISKWNTSKVTNMVCLFLGCCSLLSLPDISNWNISNVIDICAMFNECKSLEYLPDISKWNTSKVTNMSYLFKDCYSLKKLPNISIWNTNNVKEMNFMFAGCSSLSSLPDTSNWNSSVIKNSLHAFSTKQY